MNHLTEVEQRILAELEEAWAESFLTIINTVDKPTGNASEVDEICHALEGLTNSGLVRMAIDYDERKKLRPTSAEESLAVIRKIPGNMNFDASKGLWLWSNLTLPLKPYKVQIPEILVTPEGLVKARSILEERGYQWWRQQK